MAPVTDSHPRGQAGGVALHCGPFTALSAVQCSPWPSCVLIALCTLAALYYTGVPYIALCPMLEPSELIAVSFDPHRHYILESED